MSVESRSPLRSLRRSKKELERPDYSEPDFGSWAARLDSYVPAGHSTAPVESSAQAAPATSATATAVLEAPPAPAVIEAPAAPVAAARPSLDGALEKLMSFDGALGVAVVDSESGMVLAKAGSGVDIELAAAGASTILRARLASTRAMGTNEKIDDVLISLTSQVQIIHPLPNNPSIFTYLIGDKTRSSLAMARYKAAEADLQIQL
jgi:predicted regulator of Ras-like GTPase activity (Roadblock/LC7/MglB family)